MLTIESRTEMTTATTAGSMSILIYRAAWRLLLGGCLGLIPAAAPASAATISQVFGDDNNTAATIDPGVPGGIVYSCIWVDAALPKAGFKPTTGWNFTYAGATAAAFLKQDLKVEAYYPWVVNQPTYSRGGDTWGGNLNGEAGGAYLRLSYTPRAGTDDPVDVKWVQAVDSSYRGGAFDVHLDNPFNRPSPFYFGGSYSAGSTWFVDIPGANEAEYEGNPVASVDFQVFLAQDTIKDGVHNVTLFGGVWWGYRYTAQDVPEPVSLALGGFGLLLLALLHRWMSARGTPV